MAGKEDLLGAVGPSMPKVDTAIIKAWLEIGQAPTTSYLLAMAARKHYEGGNAHIWVQGQTVGGFIRRVRHRHPGVIEGGAGRYRLSPRGVDMLRTLCYSGREVAPPRERPDTNIERLTDMSQTRLPTAARVYVDGAPTIHLSALAVGDQEIDAEMQDALRRGILDALDVSGVIEGIDTDGNAVQIPARRVIDVVYPQRAEAVIAPSGVFHGKRIQVHNLADYARIKEERGNSTGYLATYRSLQGAAEHYTVVTGEDLAEAEIVVLNVETGHVAWVNPSCPEEAIARTLQAARLLAEAEELTNIAYGEKEMGIKPISMIDAEGGHPDKVTRTIGKEDHENAIAWLQQKGDIRVAVATAEDGFVEGYLAEAACGPDVLVAYDGWGRGGPHGGWIGVISGYVDGDDEQAGEFAVDRVHSDVVDQVPLSRIDAVLCWSWEDYQRTGDVTLLTEAGHKVHADLPDRVGR
jgi:hypothetical protein